MSSKECKKQRLEPNTTVHYLTSPDKGRPPISRKELLSVQIPGIVRERHRPRHNTTTDNDDSSRLSQKPSVCADGTFEFSLFPIQEHLICSICDGYFKDPHKITECLHTFCKSCLFYSMACGCHECPTCQIFLGNDPQKAAILDRPLKDLIDKAIFPELIIKERVKENHFYGSIHIPMKPESRRGSSNHKKRYRSIESKLDEDVELYLLPEKDGPLCLPRLSNSCLTVCGRLRMSQLKRYIIQKMKKEYNVPLQLGHINILCHGIPLGDEISLTFVKRLLYQMDSMPLLTYCRVDHSCT